MLPIHLMPEQVPRQNAARLDTVAMLALVPSFALTLGRRGPA